MLSLNFEFVLSSKKIDINELVDLIIFWILAPPELDAPTLLRYTADGLPVLRLLPSSSRRDDFSRYYVIVVQSNERRMPEDIKLEEVCPT